jgi:lysophospholipase L1-like esterase
MKPKAKWLAIGLATVILIGGLAAFFFETQPRTRGPANTIRVACVGDSITEGTEYPADLWMMLGANYTVGNFGVGGSTVSIESEKPYMNQTAFQDAEAFMPNIVVIILGTNDAYPSS